jgi:Ca2+-binding EF-hand superfamily protein
MKFYQSLAILALVAVIVPPAGANAQGRGKEATKVEPQPPTEQTHEGREMRFRGMDADNDGVITRDEWRGSDESFRQHDTNRDGVLSGNEVWVPVAREQGPLDRSRREQRAARFERLDTNADGRISLREWTGNRTMFDRMDLNHDQLITRDEFMEVATDRAAASTGAQAVARESQADTRAYKSGYQKGLEEGRQAGREDKTVNGGKWDLEGQRELEQADSGYRNELGMRTDYQAGYRAGFRVGYREGFGPRH